MKSKDEVGRRKDEVKEDAFILPPSSLPFFPSRKNLKVGMATNLPVFV
ncbi:MAG: hypothetical protein M3362_08910 [Acidobacteriota bacterium]|nr:hypothetical protein [Acidobacteriota bacterium]